jgi:hypothetical protein
MQSILQQTLVGPPVEPQAQLLHGLSSTTSLDAIAEHITTTWAYHHHRTDADAPIPSTAISMR